MKSSKHATRGGQETVGRSRFYPQILPVASIDDCSDHIAEVDRFRVQQHL
ncbi:MAG: hypothetical protein WA437_12125 [Candidatus Sulfotelmatobacter sp.]